MAICGVVIDRTSRRARPARMAQSEQERFKRVKGEEEKRGACLAMQLEKSEEWLGKKVQSRRSRTRPRRHGQRQDRISTCGKRPRVKVFLLASCPGGAGGQRAANRRVGVGQPSRMKHFCAVVFRGLSRRISACQTSPGKPLEQAWTSTHVQLDTDWEWPESALLCACRSAGVLLLF